MFNRGDKVRCLYSRGTHQVGTIQGRNSFDGVRDVVYVVDFGDKDILPMLASDLVAVPTLVEMKIKEGAHITLHNVSGIVTGLVRGTENARGFVTLTIQPDGE